MFSRTTDPSPWRRIERRSGPDPAADFVEVGECVRCRRGVDRAFPAEYRVLGGELVCAECAGMAGDSVVASDAVSSHARAAVGDGAPHAPAPPA